MKRSKLQLIKFYVFILCNINFSAPTTTTTTGSQPTTEIVKFTNVTFETDESVLFIEVSSIQKLLSTFYDF